MAEATFTFPRGFLWGTATSSHQVEGNNTNNNWYVWEQEGHITSGHRCGWACDWWGGRWREDFDRAAETGQNTHRLSIEWSRIQPAPNRWDEDSLDYYRGLYEYLLSDNEKFQTLQSGKQFITEEEDQRRYELINSSFLLGRIENEPDIAHLRDSLSLLESIA